MDDFRNIESERLDDILKGLSRDDLVEATWQLLKPHYKTRPVPVRQFIEDPHFLGAFFKGTRKFYPFWMKKLEEIYPSEFHSPYYELIWDLPIGAGKSLSCTSIILYEIYKLQCITNPHNFYVLADGTRIVFCIFSATLSLSTDVNWEYFENLLTASPYFQENCPLPGGKKLASKDSVVFPGDIAIDLGSRATHALGKAVFGASLDEANFQSTKSNQAHDGYLQLKRRRDSRFLGMGGSVPGKLILLSSPKLATDFLEEQKKVSRSISTVQIIENIPIWEIVKGTDKDIYSGECFQVFTGTKTQDPYIISDARSAPEGYKNVVDVPVEHKDAFEGDLLSSLRDIMGLAISGNSSFIQSPQKLNLSCVMKPRVNKEVISLDFSDSSDKLWDYVDQEYFSKIPFPEAHRFIHIDLATSRDRAAFASVFAVSDKETLGKDYRDGAHTGDVIEKRERTYYTELLIYLKAKPNEEIPFYKIRDFILYLKKSGYPLLRVSADQYQSVDMLQQLKVQGIQTESVSVDRTRIPYLSLRELIYSGKILLPNSELLKKELLELLDDSVKIDHPMNGSKDGSDAIAGAVWNAMTSEVILRPNARFPIGRGYESVGSRGPLSENARRQGSLADLTKQLFTRPNLTRGSK